MQDTAKGGALVFTVKVAPLKNDVETLVVEADCKLRLPEGKKPTSIFFVDGDGNLSRSNPNQMELPGLRDASGVHPSATSERTAR